MSHVLPLTAENLQAFVRAEEVRKEERILQLRDRLKLLQSDLYQHPRGMYTSVYTKTALDGFIQKIYNELEVLKQKPRHQFSEISELTVHPNEYFLLVKRTFTEAYEDQEFVPFKLMKLDESGTKGQVDYQAMYETIQQLTPPISPTLKYDFSPVQELSHMDEPQHEVNPDDEITEEEEPETQVVDGLQNTLYPDEDEPATQPMD